MSAATAGAEDAVGGTTPSAASGAGDSSGPGGGVGPPSTTSSSTAASSRPRGTSAAAALCFGGDGSGFHRVGASPGRSASASAVSGAAAAPPEASDASGAAASSARAASGDASEPPPPPAMSPTTPVVRRLRQRTRRHPLGALTDGLVGRSLSILGLRVASRPSRPRDDGVCRASCVSPVCACARTQRSPARQGRRASQKSTPLRLGCVRADERAATEGTRGANAKTTPRGTTRATRARRRPHRATTGGDVRRDEPGRLRRAQEHAAPGAHAGRARADRRAARVHERRQRQRRGQLDLSRARRPPGTVSSSSSCCSICVLLLLRLLFLLLLRMRPLPPCPPRVLLRRRRRLRDLPRRTRGAAAAAAPRGGAPACARTNARHVTDARRDAGRVDVAGVAFFFSRRLPSDRLGFFVLLLLFYRS